MMRSRSLLTLLAARVAACDEVIIPARDETTLESEAGRGDWIRTSDSCVPNAVLYQAELHPESDRSQCAGKSASGTSSNHARPRRPIILAKIHGNLNSADPRWLRSPHALLPWPCFSCNRAHRSGESRPRLP